MLNLHIIATKKIGKNNPKAEQIQTDNEKRMRWNREVDRAIVSGVPEAEIKQIKQEYVIDRIKESVNLFGNKPELLGSIIATAVSVLALLISKVLQKARELSAQLFDTEPIQSHLPKERPSIVSPKIQIPPKPAMTAKAAAYPKLHKIYKELKRQNEIIFEAEKERNSLENKRDSLKGLARLTKKSELQDEIERVNEKIELLKVGLSGIVKRYGYRNVQEFYKAYHEAKNAYGDYLEKEAEWKQSCGKETKTQGTSLEERLQEHQREVLERQTQQMYKSKDRGAR